MKRELAFSVREIEEKGGLTFAKTIPAEEFAEEGPPPEAWERTFGSGCLSGTCDLRLEFSVGGNHLLMEGRVAGRWTMTCSRCLAPHETAFETAVEETYPLTQDKIEVWGEVREALILSVPPRSLCSPSCLGLCPTCGRDLNREKCACAAVGGPAPRKN